LSLPHRLLLPRRCADVAHDPRRRLRPGRFNFIAIACGFLLQTGFLWMRGDAIGRCPITNMFEVFIFLAWSIVLIYIVIGPPIGCR
jgi:ABC-type transport system involved in cytochrome c biogenesis permease subunit